MKNAVRLLALLMAMLMVLTACAGNNTPTKVTDPAPTDNEAVTQEATNTPEEDDNDDDVTYKDTFTYAVQNDQSIIDGQMNVDNDKVMPMVYSFLVQRNHDGEILGDVAERWEVSEDELTWTFFLRKGVKFHNGKELTATDVKATYDRLLNEEDPVRYTQSMSFIDRCEIVDDYTIQLITLSPAGPMLPSLTLRANTLLDADYIDKYGKDLGYSVESVNGTGPFKLKSWAKDEEMVLERHDDYFGEKAKTKTVVILPMPEASSRAMALESNQIDGADGIAPDELVRLGEVDGIRVHSVPGVGCHLFQFNCGDPIVADPKIRQAISYAIDRRSIVSALFSPLGEEPRDNVMPPQAPGYVNLGVIEQDQEKAKELMAEAGYPDGFKLNLMATAVYNRGVEMGEIIKAQLEEVGIEVELEIIDRATFSASWGAYNKGELPWGMFLMGAGYVTLDGDEGLKRRFETSSDGKNANNYGFYSNAEADELFQKAATTTNQELRAQYYERAAEILYLEDPVGVYMNKRNDVAALRDTVEGFDYTATGFIEWTNIRVRDEK